MSQPRIDMRVIRRGIQTVRDMKTGCDPDWEDFTDMADELDDRGDGATILVALRKEEADVVLAGLRALQREYDQGRVRMSVSKIAALDGAIEEINAAIRGVVVPS
jgi:hypothetical protein